MADDSAGLLEPLKTELRPEEGFRSFAYKDSRGHWTIAYGFLLEGNANQVLRAVLGLTETDANLVVNGAMGLSREQGERLIDHTASAALRDAEQLVGEEAWKRLNDEAKVVVADMVFNLGSGGVGAFRRFLAAIRTVPPDYAAAEREMNDSDWDRQVPARADHLEAIIHALIPHITEVDRSRIAGLFIPMRPPAGAHAGESDAPDTEPSA